MFFLLGDPHWFILSIKNDTRYYTALNQYYIKGPQLNEPVCNIHLMISKRKIIYLSIKVFKGIIKGLGIIYFVTHWAILVSVNSKSIHQSKQKPII